MVRPISEWLATISKSALKYSPLETLQCWVSTLESITRYLCCDSMSAILMLTFHEAIRDANFGPLTWPMNKHERGAKKCHKMHPCERVLSGRPINQILLFSTHCQPLHKCARRTTHTIKSG